MMTAMDEEDQIDGVEHRIHLDSEVSLLFKSKRAKMGEAAIAIQTGFRRWQSLQTKLVVPTENTLSEGSEGVDAVRRSSGRRKPQKSKSDDGFDEFGLPLGPNLLNKLTLDNTKKNSLYTRVELVVEPVPLDQKRPDSPERKWTAKSHLSDHEEDLDGGCGGGRLRWNRKLTILDEEHGQGKAPLSPSITIPIRPILKSCRTAGSPTPTRSGNVRERVVVKKLLYLDDPERWAVEETMRSDGDYGKQQLTRRRQGKKQPKATGSGRKKKK